MSSRFVSCALTNLTRRVGGLSLETKPLTFSTIGARGVLAGARFPTPLTSTSSGFLPSFWVDHVSDGPFQQTTARTMVTRKKRLARRQKRRVEAKYAAMKEEGKFQKKEEEKEVAAPQHEAWVDFQKSISVGGFQTGQTTKARVQKKGDSGQSLRDLKRREKLELKMKTKVPEMSDVRGGEYPVGRYSDEETERLLKMAYANIPPRAGRRGTRNLKRQKRRWFLVRKIHQKKKRQVMAAHFRKMEKRSLRISETRDVKVDAVETRAVDRAYQKEVLRRWVENLRQKDDDMSRKEIRQAEASALE